MIEYVNLAAVVWLTYYILASAYQLNNGVGCRVQGVNGFPLALSIAALITLAIAVTKEAFT